ncbi:hypothetical protein CALVIDRAFT_529525 [Calocera viscosa TUFC12733]|uniref:Ubiquitin 3 binding protein But2 C-terminal domain-containing protein n=1 Tax=Calocera viscosa (strain TUFC12733) TaxID=1330018 RepID=A0A167J7W7_CALVF|nr:hypothetical protein CALVIDRAFT_529525 [Calocera viscosa TUFC12733]
MFSRQPKSKSSQYAALSLHADGEGEGSPLTSSEKALDDGEGGSPLNPTAELQQPKSLFLPKLLLYASLALALLSAANLLLLPATLSQYLAYPLSEEELAALPFPDTRLGLDRAGKMLPPAQVYWRAWPERIVRVSRKLKNAVYGNGVWDSTIMRFPVPPEGSNACAISWLPPAEFSARVKDLETKGDITEVEVWSIIAPSHSSPDLTGSLEEMDYDDISYNTLPVRGELLGTLDLTSTPNATTVEFACPAMSENLVVELRCQRVACHIAFMQIDMNPKFGTWCPQESVLAAEKKCRV